VTKEELLKAVWPETCVSAGLLHTYIRDLRDVLGEDPEAPRFIETVARRGYRFIAPLAAASQPVQSPKSKVQSQYSAFRILQSLQQVQGSRFKVQSYQHPAPNTQHPREGGS